MFPRLDLEVSYTWAGTFGETKDGLAYIGADCQNFLMPILHLAMVAMASRLASLRRRSSPTFIWVDRMMMPRFSDSIDERCDHVRLGRGCRQTLL